MIKGIIFDVDGVILDSMPNWEEIGEKYLKSLGKKGKPGLRQILFPMSLEQAADYLIREYELPKTSLQVVAEVNEMIKKFYADEVELKPGVKAYLDCFRRAGVPLVIATSSGKENVTAALNRLLILDDFQAILTCSEVGKGKDSPDIYLQAAKILGTKPEETWVFEDSCHALLTAKRAGFRTVAVYDRANKDDLEILKKESDLFLQEYSEVSGFLDHMSAYSYQA